MITGSNAFSDVIEAPVVESCEVVVSEGMDVSIKEGSTFG